MFKVKTVRPFLQRIVKERFQCDNSQHSHETCELFHAARQKGFKKSTLINVLSVPINWY